MKREDKPLRYEEHARKRMRQRGISEDQVEKTVRSPDTRGSAKREGAEKLSKKFTKTRTVIVIAEEEQGFIRIVSAYKG